MEFNLRGLLLAIIFLFLGHQNLFAAAENNSIVLWTSHSHKTWAGKPSGCLPFLDTPPVSCLDIQGSGSFDTSCIFNGNVFLEDDVCIAGDGNLIVAPNVTISCSVPGCTIVVNITGNVSLGEESQIKSGTLVIQADSAFLCKDSALSTRGLGGSPPPQTSGTPSGLDGAGGGHGGRGACCITDPKKVQDDIWGGDVYAWASLFKPWSYGSKGGTTSRDEDYGGGGGGRINITLLNLLELNGTIDADGASGGEKGGGGSGGSVIIQALKMKGNGEISAAGGSGHAGGGGGRVAIECYRQDGVEIFVHGGDSFACPKNAGAAGTRFDIVPQSLIVSNGNKTTATDTPLLDFPTHPLWANVFVECRAKVVVPLLWSRVLVRGQISISNEGTLIFGLSQYPSSEFELVAEEVVMTDSVLKVYGALKLSVKMLLMLNSVLQIDGGGDSTVSTSTMEASNLVFLRGKSSILSNANLGIHGQGMLKLSGSGDCIKSERLFLSLFYNIHIGPGALLHAPPDGSSFFAESAKLYCDSSTCPFEVINPPEDCTLNVSLPFTLQICRVEDIAIDGFVKGSVIHVQRGRTVTINAGGLVSSSALGCRGGVGKGSNSMLGGGGGGGGHGGKGGNGYFNGSWNNGGETYGRDALPCELGSGGGSTSFGEDGYGGGVVVMGSLEHPLSSLDVFGAIMADGKGFKHNSLMDNQSAEGGGGGSGGSILLFLQALTLGNRSLLSVAGGQGGQIGGGGGGGGRIHFHWANIPTGEGFIPIATVNGTIRTNGGQGGDMGLGGDEGSLTGKECPKGLFGVFCMECPVGTYKNSTGSDEYLCKPCPLERLPRRASYIYVRGGATNVACPYQCTSDKYRLPNCYTPLEELIYTLGGPWLFSLLLSSLMVALALVLSIARVKLVGSDDFSGPTPTSQSAHVDHSFPFLESLNEVLETNRVEESQSHVHRMYFMGRNSFSEPWHLAYSPPRQIVDLVYEDAFNRFVEEINCIASYQWWEGSVHNILSLVAYPVAWSWQQWRRRRKVQRLREYVRSEYDHSCLRSCRSRALYEGLKVAATPDLLLGYIDVFLGGDEKRPDLPPRLLQRLPMPIVFGGDGSYMATYHLHSDNLLTSLLGQALPATLWYRLVAGLNAQLRLVCRGSLKMSLNPIVSWLETHANPWLKNHGLRVDLIRIQVTASGYYQIGLAVNVEEGAPQGPFIPDMTCSKCSDEVRVEQALDDESECSSHPPSCRRINGCIDTIGLQTLKHRRKVYYPLSFLLHNTQPIGHQALVGLVISILLFADFSLTLLTLLQFYSISLAGFLVVLLVLPLASLLPFPAGISALFSHGPRKSAGLARVYNLWNITSLTNSLAALAYGLLHYKIKLYTTFLYLRSWSFSSEENNWWLIPTALILCKCIQARFVDFHIANLEVQDHTVYSEDASKFWECSA